MSEERPRPVQIAVYRRSRVMRVGWSDEHESEHPWEHLRWNCPCAECQGEMGVPGRLRFTERLTEDQTSMVDAVEVGRYAVQPIWQDGHSTGIYSFDLLRRLCQCPECRSAAATGP
ncbi:MAG: DUF971 domain-containing protein [Chloroflexota bacterium]|nr:MAG: DUF971 domain-containing protein [Chloroflexota bacterium]